MLTGEVTDALRALHDCKVVRARWTHPGYRQLRDRRLATAQFALNSADPDYRLTPRGEALAKDLFG